MYNNKALALSFALLLPLSPQLPAEEADDSTQAQGVETAQSAITQDDPGTAETGTQAATPEADAEYDSAPAGVGAPPLPDYSTRDHWKAREEQYQALRKRAEEAGVMLPERPPWQSEQRQTPWPSMEERMAHHRDMMSMSQEERDNYRQQRYQEIRERAEAMGMDMPETPPWVARQRALDDEWAKHQKVIEGMSDEERAACHAMLQRHMGMMPGGAMGPGGCAMGRQGCGMYQNEFAPGMAPGYGPGYGYGPAPAPYGPGNFWDPNQ